MKAVIMAGGEGTRLRPLTCDCPKPMTRLCGRPALEYILDLLQRSGVTEAAVTLKYLPGVIRDHFSSCEYNGLKLRFFEEDKPLGTAGSVKNASDMLTEDFIVISGDSLCDFNLKSAFTFHKENKAAATLLLSHVEDPREYGLVVTAADGAVKGFVEKPGWAQAVTDAVNTGIYILSPECLPLIPENTSFDFAKDLFPLMMKEGKSLYGFDADGYWCDIGDIAAYASAQFDMLEGRVECRLPGAKQGGIWFKGTRPAGAYRITPPAYIGEGVEIGEDSDIGPCAVLDDGCTVGAGTTVKDSVLLPDCYVGDKCELRGVVVGARASLKKGAGMFEGSVAGAGSVVGEDASVSPGVRIWPGKKVEDGARAAVNVKSGTARKGLFGDEGISGEIGVELTPEMCSRIGAAAGGVYEHGRIGIGCDGAPASMALKNCAEAGILSAGAQVCDFGSCFESMFNFAVSFCRLDMGIFIRCAGNRGIMRLTGGAGLGVGRAVERKIDSAVGVGELRRCRPLEYGKPYNMQGFGLLYRQELAKQAPGGLYGIRAEANSSNREIEAALSEVLALSGCAEGGIRVHVDSTGREVSFFDEEGTYIDGARALGLCCITAFENGEDVALPYDAPCALDTIAANWSRKVLRYLECPADAADREARKLAAAQLWVRDGLLCAMRVLSYLKKHSVTLAQMSKMLPDFAVARKAVPCRGNPGNIIRLLASDEETQSPDGPAEGVRIPAQGGNVLVSPLKRGDGIRIMAEAANMELADELCAFFEKKLQNDDMLDRTGQ